MDRASGLLNGFSVPLRSGHLELLVFLAAHSRTLMSSDQLARLLGAPPTELAMVLDDLTNAGLVVRKQHTRLPTAFYQLGTQLGTGAQHEVVDELLQLASTRPGLLALRRALRQGVGEAPNRHPQP